MTSPTTYRATSPTKNVQFYRRLLPTSCISFSSPEGKEIFREALQTDYMEGYFGLAAQFRTQDEPAYCGLSTLVMVLNTLEVDPKQVWKGVWRWYHENMLDCCVSLEHVTSKGITLDECACIADCNHLAVNMVRADSGASEQEFRHAVLRATQRTDEVIVASYSRRVLGQTGDGHFSPVGGYHPGRDLVLILDTARFKYPPHWVPLSLLYEAMKAFDKDTGLPRGYLRLRRNDDHPLVLFQWGTCISEFMLKGDQDHGTGIAEFLKVWKGWLQTSSQDEETDILQKAVTVIVKALACLEEGENILTTQVDISLPDTFSTEHCCVAKHLLVSLETVPLFSVVRGVLQGDAEIRRNVVAESLRQVKCSSDQQSVSESCQLEPAHIISILLLAWPLHGCGDTVGSSLNKALKVQLLATERVLQNETAGLTKQLTTMLQYNRKSKCCCK